MYALTHPSVGATTEGEIKTMSERVEALANQFDQSSGDFLTLATALSDAQWTEPFANDDPRPAGVVAHHVASGYEATTEALHGLLAGVDLGFTWEVIHGGKGAPAGAHPAPRRGEAPGPFATHGRAAGA